MAATSLSGPPYIIPERTRVGDFLMMISGSDMPWVLQPAETHSRKAFRIIGPAYVRGPMDGGAISPSTRWSEVALT